MRTYMQTIVLIKKIQFRRMYMYIFFINRYVLT